MMFDTIRDRPKSPKMTPFIEHRTRGVRMRKIAPRDFNGRTEVRKDGSVAVKKDGRMESSPRIAEWNGPSRLP